MHLTLEKLTEAWPVQQDESGETDPARSRHTPSTEPPVRVSPQKGGRVGVQLSPLMGMLPPGGATGARPECSQLVCFCTHEVPPFAPALEFSGLDRSCSWGHSGSRSLWWALYPEVPPQSPALRGPVAWATSLTTGKLPSPQVPGTPLFLQISPAGLWSSICVLNSSYPFS